MCCYGSEAKTSLYNNKQTGQLIDGRPGLLWVYERGGEFTGILGLVGQRTVVKKNGDGRREGTGESATASPRVTQC